MHKAKNHTFASNKHKMIQMKTGKFFAILGTLFFSYFLSNAQAPSWLWSTRAGGATSETAYDIASDASGNVFATGFFSSPSITFGSTTLTNNSYSGLDDFFIVKYDPSGNVLWAKSSGGLLDDYGFSLCTDLNGNVYVTGSFISSITFDSTTLISSSTEDVFVVKYAPTGNVLWARRSEGSDVDNPSDICADANGNVYITGGFASPTFVLGSDTLSHYGFGDMFLAKFDSSGNGIWTKYAHSAGIDYGNAVACDAGGNILVMGMFYSTLTFGSTILTSSGQHDNFLAKYGPNGNLLWVVKAGGTGNDIGQNISVDASNHAYITGRFDSPSLQFGSSILNSAGQSDMFLAKYDSAGTVNWASSAGGSLFDEGTAVSVDASGSVFITGRFSNTINFGSFALNTVGGSDFYVANFDSSGTAIWAVRAGGINGEGSHGICTGPGGRVLVAGGFDSPTIVFSSDTLVNDSAGRTDIFVAALDQITGLWQKMDGMEAVTIFPNPSQGKFIIQDARYPIHGFRIYNLMGELVKASDKVASMYEIDLGEEAKGLYLLKVYSGDGEVHKKILLQ